MTLHKICKFLGDLMPIYLNTNQGIFVAKCYYFLNFVIKLKFCRSSENLYVMIFKLNLHHKLLKGNIFFSS